MHKSFWNGITSQAKCCNIKEKKKKKKVFKNVKYQGVYKINFFVIKTELKVF